MVGFFLLLVIKRQSESTECHVLSVSQSRLQRTVNTEEKGS